MEIRTNNLFSFSLQDIVFMTDKQQDLKKIHKRISQIYLMVKQLGEYVGWDGDDIPHVNIANFDDNSSEVEASQNHSAFSSSVSPKYHHSRTNFSFEHQQLLNNHKDILVDDESLHPSFASYCHSSDNVNISCEEQVNRLTAQLTAAYHRIACLEEQLLSARHHSENNNHDFYGLP